MADNFSALPAAGGTDFASRFTESQARGWNAVCATLDEIDPDWILDGNTSGKTGVQRACDAIRRLAAPAAHRDFIEEVNPAGDRTGYFLFAPAAGKGVDDAALGRAYRRWYGAAKGYKDVDADAAHDFITREAALTRQPVAGDGEVAGWTLQVKRDGRDGEMGVWAVDSDGTSIWIAPADTPTDGGEGKS